MPGTCRLQRGAASFSKPCTGRGFHAAAWAGCQIVSACTQVLLQHVSWEAGGSSKEAVETQLSDLAAATLQHLASY